MIDEIMFPELGIFPMTEKVSKMRRFSVILHTDAVARSRSHLLAIGFGIASAEVDEIGRITEPC